MQIKSATLFTDCSFGGLSVETGRTSPQSPLGLRSDLSLLIIHQSSFANYSSEQLRCVHLFRGRACPNLRVHELTKWDFDILTEPYLWKRRLRMCRLLVSASAHQYGPAYWAKMKAGQQRNQKSIQIKQNKTANRDNIYRIFTNLQEEEKTVQTMKR